jgi:hypothetical protein
MTAAAPRLIPIEGNVVDQTYAADSWHADQLGIPVRRGYGTVTFTGIEQDWLRAAAKRWCRFRLATGSAFNTIRTSVSGLIKFSRFLTEQRPDVIDIGGVTRTLLEHYLSWMASSPWAINTRSNTLTMLRGFLEWGHRYGQLAGLPANAVIYGEEVTRPEDAPPRFIPEFVMNQLESDTNLGQLPNPTVRHLVVVLIETGLRAVTPASWRSTRSSQTAPAGPACGSPTARCGPSNSSR